jgi:hypothetical protein
MGAAVSTDGVVQLFSASENAAKNNRPAASRHLSFGRRKFLFRVLIIASKKRRVRIKMNSGSSFKDCTG